MMHDACPVNTHCRGIINPQLLCSCYELQGSVAAHPAAGPDLLFSSSSSIIPLPLPLLACAQPPAQSFVHALCPPAVH